MKFIVDSTGVYQNVCGVQRYSECLFGELLKMDEGFDVLGYPLRDLIGCYPELRDVDSDPAARHALSFRHYKEKLERYNRIIKETGGLVRAAYKIKREHARLLKHFARAQFREDLITHHLLSGAKGYHALYDFYPKAVLEMEDVQRFITVHDVIPAVRPELILECDRSSMRRFMEKLKTLGSEDVVITISEVSKQDLCEFNPNIDPERVHVVPLAAAECFGPVGSGGVERIRKQYGVPEGARYVLSTLTVDPKKNIARVLEAFLDLVEEEGLEDIYLVLMCGSGKFSGLSEGLIRRVEECRDRIILTGHLEDEAMAALYTGAECFVFPSLYEGFGIPVLEAMRCGAPVVTSNTSSLPEIAGEAAIQVDPESVEAIAGGMLSLLKDGGLRKDLSQRGMARAAGFSWKKCALETMAVYRQYLED